MSAYAENAGKLKGGGTVEFLLKLIPTTVVSAFATGDVLQVLLFAVLFGCALAMLGERGALVTGFVDQLSHVLFKIMGILIKLAPLGVLGAIAFTVGKYGVGSLRQLGLLVALYYASVILFVVVVLGGVMRLAGFSLFKLLRYLREELAIVFATTSSDSVLPQVMSKLRRMGIRDSTVGLVIPTGYSFNLDAFSIYITLAAVFIAQATNTPISTADLLTILAISLVTSKGAHGVPGSAIVVLAATLQAIPAIPAIGLVLVLSVDWFMGIARALGNLIGNCVATVVIAAWEGDIDKARAHAVLDGSVSAGEVDAPTTPHRRRSRCRAPAGALTTRPPPPGRRPVDRAALSSPAGSREQPGADRAARRRGHPGAEAGARRTARRAAAGRHVRRQPHAGARGADAAAGARLRRGAHAQGLVRGRAVDRRGARRLRRAAGGRGRHAARCGAARPRRRSRSARRCRRRCAGCASTSARSRPPSSAATWRRVPSCWPTSMSAWPNAWATACWPACCAT